MVFSPADVTMPTTSPFSLTIGDPTELTEIASAISKRSEFCAVIVVSRAAPSFPASALPTTATLAPVVSSPALFRSRNLNSFCGFTSARRTEMSEPKSQKAAPCFQALLFLTMQFDRRLLEATD